MMKFRYALVLVVGAALQPGPLSELASAADLPEAPPSVSLKDSPVWFPPLWQGFYFGGHLGGVWGTIGVYDNFTYVGDPTFNGSLSGTGFIGGAQAGYNWQRGHFLFGLEGDVGYLGISANKSQSFTPGSCTGYYSAAPFSVPYAGQICAVNAKYSSSSDLYGDLTGRLGYSMDRALFYVKGGAALLNADFNANYSGQSCKTLGICGNGGPSTFNFGRSDALAGWTAGAGAEYALNPSWSLKAEYQHFDFGSMSYSYSGCVSLGGTCPAGNSLPGHFTSTINGKTDVSFTADAVTLGVSYYLNSEAELK
ncbi:MAG: outer membrane beta-barrel protein [Rhodomicrobium sp.]